MGVCDQLVHTMLQLYERTQQYPARKTLVLHLLTHISNLWGSSVFSAQPIIAVLPHRVVLIPIIYSSSICYTNTIPLYKNVYTKIHEENIFTIPKMSELTFFGVNEYFFKFSFQVILETSYHFQMNLHKETALTKQDTKLGYKHGTSENDACA